MKRELKIITFFFIFILIGNLIFYSNIASAKHVTTYRNCVFSFIVCWWTQEAHFAEIGRVDTSAEKINQGDKLTTKFKVIGTFPPTGSKLDNPEVHVAIVSDDTKQTVKDVKFRPQQNDLPSGAEFDVDKTFTESDTRQWKPGTYNVKIYVCADRAVLQNGKVEQIFNKGNCEANTIAAPENSRYYAGSFEVMKNDKIDKQESCKKSRTSKDSTKLTLTPKTVDSGKEVVAKLNADVNCEGEKPILKQKLLVTSKATTTVTCKDTGFGPIDSSGEADCTFNAPIQDAEYWAFVDIDDPSLKPNEQDPSEPKSNAEKLSVKAVGPCTGTISVDTEHTEYKIGERAKVFVDAKYDSGKLDKIKVDIVDDIYEVNCKDGTRKGSPVKLRLTTGNVIFRDVEIEKGKGFSSSFIVDVDSRFKDSSCYAHVIYLCSKPFTSVNSCYIDGVKDACLEQASAGNIVLRNEKDTAIESFSISGKVTSPSPTPTTPTTTTTTGTATPSTPTPSTPTPPTTTTPTPPSPPSPPTPPPSTKVEITNVRATPQTVTVGQSITFSATITTPTSDTYIFNVADQQNLLTRYCAKTVSTQAAVATDVTCAPYKTETKDVGVKNYLVLVSDPSGTYTGEAGPFTFTVNPVTTTTTPATTTTTPTPTTTTTITAPKGTFKGLDFVCSSITSGSTCTLTYSNNIGEKAVVKYNVVNIITGKVVYITRAGDAPVGDGKVTAQLLCKDISSKGSFSIVWSAFRSSDDSLITQGAKKGTMTCS